MTSYMVALVLLGFLLFLAALQRKMNASEPPARKGRFESRPPLSRKDQAMYQRLVEAFPAPAYIVLAGVSLSALLEPKGGASLRKYAQKRAGFVVMDKSFLVLAIVELDNTSSNGNDEDASADPIFKSAGYKVMHYRKLPEVERLRAELSKQVYSAQPT